MATVRAKFKVTSIQLYESPRGTGSVKMSPVSKWPPDPNDENKSFWSATPSGTIEMHINNPAGFAPFVEAFHAGRAFYVDFTEAPE